MTYKGRRTKSRLPSLFWDVIVPYVIVMGIVSLLLFIK